MRTSQGKTCHDGYPAWIMDRFCETTSLPPASPRRTPYICTFFVSTLKAFPFRFSAQVLAPFASFGH